MQFTLFCTANCLYVIFFIFLILLQLALKFYVSFAKMLQLLGALAPRSPARASPLDLTGGLPSRNALWFGIPLSKMLRQTLN